MNMSSNLPTRTWNYNLTDAEIVAELNKNFPPKFWEDRFPDLAFVEYKMIPLAEFLNAETVDNNKGIRELGTPDAPELRNDLEVNNWDCSLVPPSIVITLDGKKREIDGRTRSKELKVLGATMIPVAILRQVEEENTPISNAVGRAIRSNKHKYSKGLGHRDFVAAALAACRSGEVKPNGHDILKFLEEKCDIYEFYSKDGHWVTRILNGVLENLKKDENLVTNLVRESWMDWMREVAKIDIDAEKINVLKTGGNAVERFFTRHVVPAVQHKPAKIVLFVDTGFTSKAVDEVRKFRKELNAKINEMDRNVQSHLPGIRLNPIPHWARYKIVGICPQLAEHSEQFEKGELISYEDFVS